MNTDAEVRDMYRALRPRGTCNTSRVVRTIIRCALFAWLGWCVVEAARAASTAVQEMACVQAGNAWSPDGVCTAPTIELHIDKPDAAPKNPLNGPGGA